MATEITDPMTMAVKAMALVDERAALVREVATRLIAEGGEAMPPLLAVSLEASTNRAHITLQSSTEADAALWAQAFGMTLTDSASGATAQGHAVHHAAEFEVSGAEVRISAVTWVPAARDAAVAA
ncbi:hypothetical protein ACYSUO_18455 [Streptomyces sp. UC4497]